MSQTQLSYREHPWMGVFPATLCPFNADERRAHRIWRFAPELMVDLVDACVAGDKTAKQAQKTVAPLARLIYNFGEPGCSAHQRMKVALWLMGHISNPVFRRPTRPLTAAQVDRIRADLHAIGYKTVH